MILVHATISNSPFNYTIQHSTLVGAIGQLAKWADQNPYDLTQWKQYTNDLSVSYTIEYKDEGGQQYA